jgi:hypothetical protein
LCTQPDHGPDLLRTGSPTHSTKYIRSALARTFELPDWHNPDVTDDVLTTADYASIEHAAEELTRRGWRTAFSPNAAMSAWESFVDAVERGYEMTIYDYTNDLSVRRFAEEARPLLTAVVRRAMDARLAPLDDRFRSATVEAGQLPGAGQRYWWETRLPRALRGDLAEDVTRMGLRHLGDTSDVTRHCAQGPKDDTRK